jgi:crotonobetainyl-CoA:carnitine CoA-transferase CaiB-like acyl-CoA transferase
MSYEILKGVKVLELGVYAACPWLGRLLQHMGAEVLKVETLTGDPQRVYGFTAHIPCTDDENPQFIIFNEGKKSICLDLKTPEGKEVMLKLMKESDIFITNTRIEGLKRMGLDYDSIKDACPRLIYGHLSGYGFYGEDASLPGFDVTAFWSRSGLLNDGCFKGKGPMATVYGMGDSITGSVLCNGLLAALYNRERTGKGEYVLTSLYGTAIGVLLENLVSVQDLPGYNEVYPRDWNYPPSPVLTTYPCQDGAIFLALLNHEKLWPGFCKAIGREEWANDPRYCTKEGSATKETLEALVPQIAEIFMQHDMNYWAEKMGENDIPASKVGHFKDVYYDDLAWQNGYLNKFTYDNGATGGVPQMPIFFGDYGPAEVKNYPYLGEHSEEVLKHLGYTDGQIAEMRAKKVTN